MRETLPFLCAALLLTGCGGGDAVTPPGGADLTGFEVARVFVDTVEFEVYLATTPAQRNQGLSFATPAQIAPLADGTPRGMLFVFPTEVVLSFYMKDTFVPLDLAYARGDGTVVEVHALVPLDETPVLSGEPAQYALEVPAGTLDVFGLGPGAVITPP